MRDRNAHSHPCSGCQVSVECDGELERNFDGWPEVICTSYHLLNGETAEVLCEACAELVDRCDEAVA